MEEEKKNSEAVSSETEQEISSERAKDAQEDLHGENLGDRVKVLSPGQMVAKRFFRSKLSVIGLVTIVLLFLFSFVGPLFSPWTGPNNDGKVADKENIRPEVSISKIEYRVDGELFVAYDIFVNETQEVNARGDSSWLHWLGTDDNGWDLLTRLMLGGRISLTIGFVVVFLETILGVLLGGLSGYFGGWVDNLIMRIVDILNCIPTIPIMLILSVVFYDLDGTLRLYCMMGILSLIGWAGTARLVRGQILSLREQEFMLAAKCSGLSTSRKIFKHLLPNVLPQLIVSMTLGLGSIILTEATLGYLGLGVDVGTATWGSMINKAQDMTYLETYPNFWVPAGICITLAILAFNFVGDGLRDAFDPKMKR